MKSYINLNNRFRFASAILSLALLVQACGSKADPAAESTAPAIQPEGGKRQVVTAVAWCAQVACTGKVDAAPQAQAAIHAPMGGFIKGVHHLPGDFVRAGEVLATLEHQDLIALQEEYLNVQSQLALSEKTHARNALLASVEAIPVKQQEETQTGREVLQVKLSGLGGRLRLLGIDPGKLQPGTPLQGAVRITAPISGYLTAVDVVQGQFVASEQRLFTVVDDTQLHLALHVVAKSAGLLKEGQALTYAAAGDTAVRLAHIHRINKAVDSENGMVEVHAHMEKAGMLPVGTYINAQVCTDTVMQIAWPATAVFGEGEDKWVWVWRNGKYEKQPVSVGTSRSGMSEIRGGLKAGEEAWRD